MTPINPVQSNLGSIDFSARDLALKHVDISGTLRDMYSEMTVTHTYENTGEHAVETTYTFPLPQEAVLLGVTLTIGGETRVGVVMARPEAAETYENAVCDGDSAVLLQQVDPGIYSLNLANLLPGERASITFRYGQFHRAQSDTLRFHLPTTIGPRYGNPAAAGIPPHAEPMWTLTDSRMCSITLSVEGELASEAFTCVSHATEVCQTASGYTLSLSGPACRHMDRDFVVNIQIPEPVRNRVRFVEDGDETLAWLCVRPTLPTPDAARRRCFQVVVDCSGSMAGASIAQARLALNGIYKELEDGDYFNVTLFGTAHESLFRSPKPAHAEALKLAFEQLGRIEANLGGTETELALESVMAQPRVAGVPTELLLITDGQIWDHAALTARMAQRSVRVFTIGVGSAVSEGFLKELSYATGGACELVSPREGMAERVLRQFHRMRQPKVHAVSMKFNERPLRVSESDLNTLHSGDTAHLFAWFSERPSGQADIEITFADGQILTLPLQTVVAPDLDVDVGVGADSLPRMAAADRLRAMAETDAALAERYQLVTDATSLVLVLERSEGEKASDLPELQRIPNVLPAGWGGMGDVRVNESETTYIVARRSRKKAPKMSASRAPGMRCTSPSDAGVYPDMPAFLLRQGDDGGAKPEASPLTALVATLNQKLPTSNRVQPMSRWWCATDPNSSELLTLKGLLEFVPKDSVIIESLRDLLASLTEAAEEIAEDSNGDDATNAGADDAIERRLIATFLSWLMDTRAGAALNSTPQSILHLLLQNCPIDTDLKSKIQNVLGED